MIIFLYGQDSYRRLEKLNEIVDVYRERHGSLGEGRFDLSSDEEFFKFKEFIVNRSMFDTSKLVVLDNAFETKEKAALKNILKRELKNKDMSIIISSDNKPPQDFHFLVKPGESSKSQEFERLDNLKLTAFIKKEASKRGLKLSKETTDSLKDIFDGDSWGVITELEKLSLSKGEAKEIRAVTTANFYELINSFRKVRDVGRKLVLLEIVLSGLKEDPARVFNTLAYGTFGGEALKAFADYDIAVKSGRLDYEEALVDLALL